MTTNEPITIGNCYYDYSTNYAAVCCDHVHWRKRLTRSQVVSGQLIVASAKCPFCGDQLVFGEWDGEKNSRECGYKHLGKVLALFNKPCKVTKKSGCGMFKYGHVCFVRIFKRKNGNDSEYYFVPYDHPEMNKYMVYFGCEQFFNESMKLISQTEFDCYFTSQRFDL